MRVNSETTVVFSMQRPSDPIWSDQLHQKLGRKYLLVCGLLSLLVWILSRDILVALGPMLVWFCLYQGIRAIFSRLWVPRRAEIAIDQVSFIEGTDRLIIKYEAISEIELVTTTDSYDRYIVRGIRPDRFTVGRSLIEIRKDTPYSRELVEALNRLRDADLAERPKIFASLDPKLFTPASLTKTASE